MRPAVLVVDEPGHLGYGPDPANVPFHVVDARCIQGRSRLFTTYEPLEDWGAALNDYGLAGAILDRILIRAMAP